MEFWMVLLIAGALLVGAAIGWFAGRSRDAATRARFDAEQRAWVERGAAAEQAHAQRMESLESAHAQQVAALDHAHAQAVGALEHAHAQQRETERASAAARLAAQQELFTERLDAERTNAAQRLDEVRADRKRFADEFQALSSKALEANTRQFLDQAEERLKRAQDVGAAELAKREAAVKQLVEPLSRTLGEVKAEVTAAEKARIEAHSVLAEQVLQMRSSSDLLREETGQLVTALRAPQVRGRWGELQLRRVVEAAGMLKHVDFSEQESLSTDGGLLRPDLVVNLPGDKRIVVDSKVAFGGYLEAMEAKTESDRDNRLAAHARHLRQHIDDLGAKAYWEHVANSPEFVVMFVPAENFLNAALEQDPTLMERAFAKNVVLATPATLVALLRTVGYTWRQEVLTAEAQQVLTVGRELHKRLGTLGGHLTVLGKRLNSTVEAYNKFNSSLDSQVVTQARRFSALQGLEDGLDTAPPLEVMAVPVHKPDLFEDERSLVLQPGLDETDALVEASLADAARAAVGKRKTIEGTKGDGKAAIVRGA